MLTIPWFVVKTVQDLFRLTPTPLEDIHLQQQQQQQEQIQQSRQQQVHKQLVQQQQQNSALKQQQIPVLQQRKPVVTQLQQQNTVPQQQKSAPQQQTSVPQQQKSTPQVQLQQQNQVPQQQSPVSPKLSPVPQQRSPIPQQQSPTTQQRSPVPQQQSPTTQQRSPVPQQQSPAPQQQQKPVRQQQTPASPLNQQTVPQQQQQPVPQQQTPASPLNQQPKIQEEITKSNIPRAQNSPLLITPSPTATPVSAVSTDTIQAQTVVPLQAAPASHKQTEHSPHRGAEVPHTLSLTPASEPSLAVSSRTLLLTPSVSGSADKMSFEWAQKQVEKFKFDFEQADKDNSGALSFDEVYNVLQTVGFRGTQDEAKSIFQHLDRDRDQKVTKEEFTATLKNLPRLSIKEFVLRKAFLHLDKDHSGYLSRSEIIDATKSDTGLDIAAEKISDLLIYLSKEDDDQKVNYEEFLYVFGVESAATVMKQVFSKLDTDGSGYLTLEELLDAVKAEHELNLQADKISDLLIYRVKDQDKKINYQEFVEVWLKEKRAKTPK